MARCNDLCTKEATGQCALCDVLAERDRFIWLWFKGGILIDLWRAWRDRRRQQTKVQEPTVSKSTYSKYDRWSFKEFEAPDVTAWKLARTVIEHENILVNQRLTWLLTSHAFLFTFFSGLFVALERNELEKAHPLIPYFMLGIGFLGIYICLVVQNGLSRAFTSLDNVTKHYDRIVKESFGTSQVENQGIPLTRTPPLHYWKFRIKYIDQFYLPAAMAFIWLFLLYFFTMYITPETREDVKKIIDTGTALTILKFIAAIVTILIIMIMPRGCSK